MPVPEIVTNKVKTTSAAGSGWPLMHGVHGGGAGAAQNRGPARKEGGQSAPSLSFLVCERGEQTTPSCGCRMGQRQRPASEPRPGPARWPLSGPVAQAVRRPRLATFLVPTAVLCEPAPWPALCWAGGRAGRMSGHTSAVATLWVPAVLCALRTFSDPHGSISEQTVHGEERRS